MSQLLFWIYLANAVFLINHEIDSAYWREWDLFKLKGGISLFLILHFPILFTVLYGLVEVSRMSSVGMVLSLILSAGGIFAFIIHTYFLKKGRPEFRAPVSIFILISTLVLSLAQALLTAYMLLRA